MFIDFIFLIAAVFTIYLGISVWIRGGSEVTNKTFTLFAVTLGLWATSLVLLNQTGDTTFSVITLFFATVSVASLPLFMYTFPHNGWPKKVFWISYIPLLPALYIIATQPLLHIADGLPIPILNLPFIIHSGIIAFYLIFTLAIYLIRFSKSEGADRLRIQYIGLGLVTFIIMGIIGMVILPFFGDYSYLFTAPMSAFLVLLTLTALAVLQKELIDIRIVVSEIIVFLAAGIVLINNLLKATGTVELVTTGFLLALFLFTASRLVALLIQTIQQRKKLNETNKKLKELMDIKSEFLQIASHQLRAPLTSLYGLIQMQADGYLDELPEVKQHEIHRRMLKSASQLRELVNDLLRALKLEGDHIPLTFEKTNVLSLLKDAIDNLKPSYDEKGLFLKLDHEKNADRGIMIDKDFMRQVFMNIIDNSRKYTLKGGASITVKTNLNDMIITITDTGIGIAPDEFNHLFEKFARSKRAQAIKEEGTGLGLYIAKKIMTAHHGSLEITSEGEDKGTKTKITIPLQQPKGQTKVSLEAPEPAA